MASDNREWILYVVLLFYIVVILFGFGILLFGLAHGGSTGEDLFQDLPGGGEIRIPLMKLVVEIRQGRL